MRFAPFRQPWFTWYWLGGMLLMAGDHVEHAVSYYVMWEAFESPVLAGFAVLSHWLPFLLLSVPAGQLADRIDCRRVIQAAAALYAFVSLGWAAAIGFGVLAPWMCVVLLLLHGLAGAVWIPAGQLMLYDLAGPGELPSAVRLMATGTQLGLFIGPSLGALLLFVTGPVAGMLGNVLLYVPFAVVLALVPFDGHTRGGRSREPFRFRDAFTAVRDLPRYPVVLVLVVLQSATAIFFGHALLPFLPAFGERLGVFDEGLAYGVLISAMAAGSVLGGVAVEVVRIRSTVRLAVSTTLLFAVALLVFAVSGGFPLAVAALVVAGAASLVSASTSQALVQLEAPPDQRGRFMGLYGATSMGLRFVGGIVVGASVAAFGAGWGFAATSAVLVAIAAALLVVPAARARRDARVTTSRSARS